MTLDDLADLFTVIALPVALIAIFLSLRWRRTDRAEAIVRTLTGEQAQALADKVYKARVALGVTDEVIANLTQVELDALWRSTLQEAYGGGRERVRFVFDIVALANLTEEAAQAYLSFSARRRILRETLRPFLRKHHRKFRGFYRYYVENAARESPPRRHGYAKVERLAEKWIGEK